MNNLQPVFQRVVLALENAGVPYSVVGSVAASNWGVVRTTRDIDMIAFLTEERVEKLIGSLSGDDLYVPVEEVRRSPTTLGSFNILHPESGGKIDVFVRAAGDNFDSARLLRRVRARLLGQDTWVCTAEDIILAKLLWRLETRSERQWQDCAELASFNDLDVNHMRQWAKKLGVVEDLEDLLAQVTQLEN